MKLLAKRIPSILGLIILVAGLAAGVFLVRQKQQLSPQAAASLTPQNVAVSNVSDRSFTITWTTAAPTGGRLSVAQTGQTVGRPTPSTAHAVVVDNLRPNTQYEFLIESGGNLFDRQGKSFTVVTGPTLSDAPPPADIAQGAVKTAAGALAAEVIIYAQLPSGQLLSTITADSGNWLLPLSVSRTADLSAWLAYDLSATSYTILAQGGARGSAEVIVTTGIDQPLPPIILGQNADFRQKGKENQAADYRLQITGEPMRAAEANLRSLFNFETLGPVTPVVADVTLLNPGEEGERISTTKPELFGEGPTGTEVNITVESPQTVSGNAVVADDGKWKFAVPTDLAPGSHTVTLQWTDADGVIQALKRSFVVQAASGESAFTASPSAVPTKKLTPTAAPRKTVPATASAAPKSGGLTPSVMLSMMGILLVIGGMALLSNKRYLEGGR